MNFFLYKNPTLPARKKRSVSGAGNLKTDLGVARRRSLFLITQFCVQDDNEEDLTVSQFEIFSIES